MAKKIEKYYSAENKAYSIEESLSNVSIFKQYSLKRVDFGFVTEEGKNLVEQVEIVNKMLEELTKQEAILEAYVKEIGLNEKTFRKLETDYNSLAEVDYLNLKNNEQVMKNKKQFGSWKNMGEFKEEMIHLQHRITVFK